MAKVKAITNDAEPRITNVDLKALDVLGYDSDNLYPQRCIDITNDSGTAKASLKLFTKFTFGRGMIDVDFGKAIINQERLTVNKLVRKTCKSIGRHNGVALHVNYNGLLEKTSVSIIPWQYCRLTIGTSDKAGMIAVYDDWGLTKPGAKSIKKQDIDYIHKYDPSKVLEQVEAIEVKDAKNKTEEEIEVEQWSNYQGQIFYFTPDGSNEYTLAEYDPVLEDMQTEGEMKRFKKSSSKKNFLASQILIVGKSEDGEDDDEFDENLRKFQGGEGAGSILVIEQENADEQIELKKVDIQNYDGVYEYTEKSSKASIRENAMIPPVLYTVQANGGIGDSTAVTDAKIFYNDVTEDSRMVVGEIFEELFSNFYKDINSTDDYSLMPLAVNKPIPADAAENFTKDEIRASHGYAPSEEEGADETTLAQKLGVGGTQSLTGLIADPALNPEQKKGSMIVLFGLSEEQANQMLGVTDAAQNIVQ